MESGGVGSDRDDEGRDGADDIEFDDNDDDVEVDEAQDGAERRMTDLRLRPLWVAQTPEVVMAEGKTRRSFGRFKAFPRTSLASSLLLPFSLLMTPPE